MSAVASVASVNLGHDPATHPDTYNSPSRFTTVDGREQPLTPFNGAVDALPGMPTDSQRRPSELDRAVQPTTQEEDSGTFFDSSAVAHDSDKYLATACRSSGGNKNKRKRSESDERPVSSSTNYQTHRSVSRSPAPRAEERVDPQIQEIPANGVAVPNSHVPSDGEGTHFSSQSGYSTIERNNDIHPTVGPTWEGYDPALPGHGQLTHTIDTDVQLAEALQRDVHQGPEGASKNWATSARSEDGGGDPNRKFSSYAGSPTTTAAVSPPPTSQDRQSIQQVGPKRKRVFSNRTKTGCMTCRKRKKKCDEQHPSCNNCLRGGFLCEGYSSRSTWKPSSSKGTVPLQSKEGYHDVSNPYVHEMSPQRHERPSTVRTDTDVSPVGMNHICTNQLQEQPKDYHAVMKEISHTTHPKPGIPVYSGGLDGRTPHQPTHVDSNNYPAQARMALNIEPHITFESNGKTEKEKMLAGEPYIPSDPQLIREREQCKASLWRFTNSRNPNVGASPDERTRLLRQVLQPPIDSHAESSSSSPLGSLGPGAIVESPFNCHYGYNINIGEDVLVSENCFMADDCSITIGAHTWIGPNVTILSSMAMGSMQERKGSQSRYQGRPVVIAEDCWIGAGCTIMPGVTLGRGAYIASGEVVTSQILPYGFQGLKPNYP